MGDIGWIIVTIAGLCIGIGLGFWLGKAQRGADSAKLAEARAELEGYRARVTEHFSQSAAHFHAIGRQYRELYEHMAAGSDELCKQSDRGTPLHFPSPEAVAAIERRDTADSQPDAGDSHAGASAAVRPVDYAVDEAGEDDAPRVFGATSAPDPESSDDDRAEADEPAAEEPVAAESAQSEGDSQPSASTSPEGERKSGITDETLPADTPEPEPQKRLYH